ncbi:MAG: hypothetical protein JNK24_06450 [Alphaproteobacteria bacterium]|nr:hypothetical protein [Alphaproteobacteria bacterium]
MMSALISAIEVAVIDRLLNNKPPSTTGLKWIGALCMVSFTLMVLGMIFIIYAGHIWLSNQYSAEVAALVTGGLCIVLALLVLLGVYSFVRYKRNRVRKYKEDVTELVSSGAELLGEYVKAPLLNNPKSTLLLAAIIGFIAARKI